MRWSGSDTDFVLVDMERNTPGGGLPFIVPASSPHITCLRSWRSLPRFQRSLLSLVAGMAVMSILVLAYSYRSLPTRRDQEPDTIRPVSPKAQIDARLEERRSQRPPLRPPPTPMVDLQPPPENQPQQINKPHIPTFKGPENDRQRAVVAAMKHAWAGYKRSAWGKDQLRPISGGYSEWFRLGLTIIDSLDTLIIMDLTQGNLCLVLPRLSWGKDKLRPISGGYSEWFRLGLTIIDSLDTLIIMDLTKGNLCLVLPRLSWGKDQLRPISGGYSEWFRLGLTIIDSLDTLIIMDLTQGNLCLVLPRLSWGKDQLRPISGGYSEWFRLGLTIIDSLDTLIIMDLTQGNLCLVLPRLSWGKDQLRPISGGYYEWFRLGLTIIDSLDTLIIMDLTQGNLCLVLPRLSWGKDQLRPISGGYSEWFRLGLTIIDSLDTLIIMDLTQGNLCLVLPRLSWGKDQLRPISGGYSEWFRLGLTIIDSLDTLIIMDLTQGNLCLVLPRLSWGKDQLRPISGGYSEWFRLGLTIIDSLDTLIIMDLTQGNLCLVLPRLSWGKDQLRPISGGYYEWFRLGLTIIDSLDTLIIMDLTQGNLCLVLPRLSWGKDQLRPISGGYSEWFRLGLTIIDSLDTLIIMDLTQGNLCLVLPRLSWGKDQLRPISGGYSEWFRLGLTIIDSLDTLIIMDLTQGNLCLVLPRLSWGKDQLRPISGGYSEWFRLGLTIIDSLDTLIIMDLTQEFGEAREWVANSLSFDKPNYVSLFETTIRCLGGLLSAFHLSGDSMFLDKAKDLGFRLTGAFKSPSKIPFSDVNLRTKAAKNPGWSSESSLAEFTTIQLEFRDLSRQTRLPIFEMLAFNASEHVHRTGCDDGLCPMFMSPKTGAWHQSSTLTFGARSDSYYEYLLKQWVQTGKTIDWLREDYAEAMKGMNDKLIRFSEPNKLTFVGELLGGKTYSPKMDHLVCFIAGTLALGTLHGFPKEHLDLAKAIGHTCHEMYRNPSGLGPEIAHFNMLPVPNQEDLFVKPLDAHSLLRPEAIEAWFYLHRVTRDPIYQEWGWQAFQAIEKHAKVGNGYSSVSNVKKVPVTHRDLMESFFLAETLKYLYLLFSDSQSELPLTEYVFNTEAHPLPIYAS